MPLSPGGMTRKEQPAITHVTTSWLETDKGAVLALMHMPEFIWYEPAKLKNGKPEEKTGSGDLAEPEKLEPEPSEEEGAASDAGSTHSNSNDSDDDSEEDRVETHKRQILQSDLDLSSSTDSEEGNTEIHAELVKAKTNIAKFDKKVHDSGIGDTSDGGTVKVTPLLNAGQEWTRPAGPPVTSSRAYLATLETLADEQITMAAGLDKDYAQSSLMLLSKIK